MPDQFSHQEASNELLNGVKWVVTYCGQRHPIAGSDTSDGFALPPPCPECAEAKTKADAD